MGSTLTWFTKPKAKSLPCELKRVLEKKYSLDGFSYLDGNDISYLNGLKDSGINGADELIELIEKHGEVYLKLEY